MIRFMVLLEGKKLADKILEELKTELEQSGWSLRLAVVVVGENPAIRKFIEQKKKVAHSIGVDVRIHAFDQSTTTNELRKCIAQVVHEKRNSGVIVQLPLPPHINAQYILNAVMPEKDVDVLSARSIGNFVVGKNEIVPPVAGAVKAFMDEYALELQDKRVVVLGGGNLVGRPVALWLVRERINFTLVSRESERVEEILKQADVLISGIGKPKFVTGSMLKDGVIVFDAGTSESEGKLVGDVDFETVSPKAAFVTPVPGGIGPVTIAILLRNLVTLAVHS